MKLKNNNIQNIYRVYTEDMLKTYHEFYTALGEKYPNQALPYVIILVKDNNNQYYLYCNKRLTKKFNTIPSLLNSIPYGKIYKTEQAVYRINWENGKEYI